MVGSWRIAVNIENIISALAALKANRFRTFLTLLGVIIGVAAVIIVGAAVKSGETIIFEELETFGLRSLWVYRSLSKTQPGRTQKSGTGIDNDDIAVILKNSRLIERLTPVISASELLWAKYKNKYLMIKFLAVGIDYAKINNDSLCKGRFIMPDDQELKHNICIIGPKVVDKLFRDEDPLGQEIRVGNNKYKIVGILKEKTRDFLSSIGSIGGQDENDRVIIPSATFQRQYNTSQINYIQAEAINISLAKAAAEEIKNILHLRHKGQFIYESVTMQQYIETANRIIQGVGWIGGIAAIVSLVVGGIGIMNIMTVSVVERIKEIGLRKALGATKSDIMIQFIFESIFISIIGGSIGTVIGIVLIWIIQLLSHKPRLLALEYVIIALIVSGVIGVFSGLYPAHRAASLDPVEALRYE